MAKRKKKKLKSWHIASFITPVIIMLFIGLLLWANTHIEKVNLLVKSFHTSNQLIRSSPSVKYVTPSPVISSTPEYTYITKTPFKAIGEGFMYILDAHEINTTNVNLLKIDLATGQQISVLPKIYSAMLSSDGLTLFYKEIIAYT